jgi:hypothetical protein
VDQLALIIRYALYQDYDHGVIQERFIQFIPIGNHGSEYLADIVIAELENLGISIEFCRGQTYDNAPNMAGCHTGLRARILFLNPKAEWVPCAGHSLNLVGTSAVATSVEAVTLAFFNLCTISSQPQQRGGQHYIQFARQILLW